MQEGADVSDAELRWALDNELFAPLFQPIVRLCDGVPVALEALARLNHPDRGTIEPNQFVPQIEGAGLSLPLADQMAAQALAALFPGFLDANALAVAVNLPLDVLLKRDSLEQLDVLRARNAVPVHCLSVELTESQPVEDLPALGRAIERWRAAGYDLALDDISPGMRHRRALLDLPFTAVKLDKAAVQAESGGGFVAEVVAAAKARGLTVIAEGIEDQRTWDRMRRVGADQVQGFHIARPLPAAALPDWIAGWRTAKPSLFD